MNGFFVSRKWYRVTIVTATIVIVVSSVVTSDKLIHNLQQEEREKIAIWADATRVMTSENPSLDMNLILKIIEGNNTIPVLVCNEKNEVLFKRNLTLPENPSKAFVLKKIRELRSTNEPIIIDLKDGSYQYFYYDDSTILKRLYVYPYILLFVVFIFVLIAFLALFSVNRAEQNKVWVGLSKETAHQLGTPISSLMAWVEVLRMQGIDPSFLEEMEKDVNRLQMIAERFSKIGSIPALSKVNIINSLQVSIDYMRTRISKKVNLTLDLPKDPVFVYLNEALFSWVVENLVKNAVDAMNGQGSIHFSLQEREKNVRIEVSDTGKGIPKSKFKTVFSPGYTTKKRGWGLGLSLVKRIVQANRGGKIYVYKSELGKGTVFRVELQKYKGIDKKNEK